MTNEVITWNRLQELLSYNPESGGFTWKSPTSFRVKPGDKAGNKNVAGYVTIRIDGKAYYAHRLAMLYVEGVLPEKHVDHINGLRDDNRYVNLRHADSGINNKNRAEDSRNTSGTTGVYWSKSNDKWKAQITSDGKESWLGYFEDKEMAIKARKDAERELGFHENHGKKLCV